MTLAALFAMTAGAWAQNPEVTWDAATKTGTFQMPAGNVELQVTYYQDNQLAWDGLDTSGGAAAYAGFPFTAPTLTNPNNLTVSYESSDPAVATIDAATGAITTVAAGTTTITAKYTAEDTDFAPGEVSYQLTVTAPATLTLAANDDAMGSVTVDNVTAQQTYSLTFDGFQNKDFNRTVSNVTFPFVVSGFDDNAIDVTDVFDSGVSSFNAASVTSGGDGKVSVSTGYNDLTITIAGAFEGTATIRCPAMKNIAGGFSSVAVNITVTCVADPAPVSTGINATATEGVYSVLPDTEVTVHATANEGYRVSGWTDGTTAITEGVTYAEGSNPATSALTYTMPADGNKTITALFAENAYDVTFVAENANTIEAGAATVKVGDTEATVTEGKLEGVKKGQTVTMTAAQGYKFRKVEAKEGAALLSVNVSGAPTFYYAEGETWRQAIANHPDKNAGWIDKGNYVEYNDGYVSDGNNYVNPGGQINSGIQYSLVY